MSFPQVFDNERVIPQDFRAQTDAIEDAIGAVISRLISTAQAGKGIVVEGCKPSASFDAADPRRVRIEPGYILMPPSAGDAGPWRLAYIPAITYLHPDAGPTPRTDCICVAMTRVDGPVFEREYRVVDAAGVESVDPSVQTATTYTAEGAPLLAKSAGNVPAVGTVRLGTVTVNANGTITVADLRDHAFPVPTYGAPATPWDTNVATVNEGGRFWRTAGQAVAALSGALKQVATRAGALQRTLATADEGPSISITAQGLDFVMNLGLRHLIARAVTATGNAGAGDVTSTNGDIKAPLGRAIAQQFRFVEVDDSFDVDPTGRTMTVANNQRATVQVDLNVDVDDVYVAGSARWIGQNIQSIQRIEPGHWRVRFDMNQMPDNLNNRRWRIAVHTNRAVGASGSYPTGLESAGIIHQIGKGPTDDSIDLWFFAVHFLEQLAVVTEVETEMAGGAVTEVTTTTTNLNPLHMVSWDCPFSVHLYGPLPSGNWDWAPVEDA